MPNLVRLQGFTEGNFEHHASNIYKHTARYQVKSYQARNT